jgi:ATP-dependent Clp protease ATP-binding subunit ClpA/post-segregation antitoxin (ccd killing protein)
MMPKINVYVSDELAEAIKESGVPVSAVCQRALETAVRRVTAIREATLTPATGLDDHSDRLTHFTLRARNVVKLAVEEARDHSAAEVGTEHLLAGILAEGGNLALSVLSVIDIDPDQVRRELDRQFPPVPTPAAASVAALTLTPDSDPTLDVIPDAVPEVGLKIGSQAASALELAVTEATAFGHNYVGCEHLLLGLIAEPDGAGGSILRSLGADLRLTRRAVGAALAGYIHLRAQKDQPATPPTVTDPMTKLSALIEQQIQPVVQRLERIEGNLGI